MYAKSKAEVTVYVIFPKKQGDPLREASAEESKSTPRLSVRWKLRKAQRSSNQGSETPAIHYKDGAPADGYSSKVPSGVLKKLSKISVQQREAIHRKMIELRNRGLGSEERRKIYKDTLDRTIQGKRN